MKDVNSLTWLGTIKEELSELSWYHVSAADGLSITSFCPRPWNLVGRARGGQQRGAKHRTSGFIISNSRREPLPLRKRQGIH